MTVDILYASSELFAPILCVSVASLLDNREEGTRYDIHILVEKRFSPSKQKLFDQLTAGCPGVTIQWLELGDLFEHTRMNAAGVGKESNYRLVAAEKLPGVDKCLYLDADTLVLKDLSKVMALDMDGKYLRGLRPLYFLDKATDGYTHVHIDKFGQMIKKRQGTVKYNRYIGAGVMLMNLALLRSDDMAAQFLAEVPRYSAPTDQDILNACCYEKIDDLPVEFCLDLHDSMEPEWYKEHYPDIYAQLMQAMTDPCIIHYADVFKPWKKLGVMYEMPWWKYAFESGAYEYLWPAFSEMNQRPVTYYEEEVLRIKNSWAYRVGELITLIPKKIVKEIRKRSMK